MSEETYKRIEKTIIVLMLIGMVAMFQPWFRAIAGLFDPLTADGNLGRLYSQTAAPIIFRYGFYILLISTVAFTSFSHYSAEDLQRAVQEKGQALTWLLIGLPLFVGYALLMNLAGGFGFAAFLGIFAFICAIAIWNWRLWGVFGYGLLSIWGAILAFIGTADPASTIINLILTIVISVLLWPHRRNFH